ncbi:MAG: hypothetical protein ABIQ44_00385, partial [Chloroflexia bacterium]
MGTKIHTYTSAPATSTWPAGNTLTRPTSTQQAGSMALFMPAWRDYLNIALILAAVVGMLLLVSPARNFPIADDWCYTQSVDALLNGAYRPHEYSMATGIGHIGWGALVQLALGTGFTTLAFANVVMGAACLVLFYLLLRHLAVPAAWAMLGVAALGVSPMFIYLSYSFITDVTFVTYSLAALLCYVRATQYAQLNQNQVVATNLKPGALRVDLWLLAGSTLAALAYLTRQLGLILPVMVLAYLWWSKLNLSWRRVFVLGALPVGAAVAFTL